MLFTMHVSEEPTPVVAPIVIFGGVRWCPTRGISRVKITFERLLKHLHPTASISDFNLQSFVFLPFFSKVLFRCHHPFLPLCFCRPPFFLVPLTSTI